MLSFSSPNKRSRGVFWWSIWLFSHHHFIYVKTYIDSQRLLKFKSEVDKNGTFCTLWWNNEFIQLMLQLCNHDQIFIFAEYFIINFLFYFRNHHLLADIVCIEKYYLFWSYLVFWFTCWNAVLLSFIFMSDYFIWNSSSFIYNIIKGRIWGWGYFHQFVGGSIYFDI